MSKIEFQTDGYIVVGELRNEERYRCLICRNVPEVVRVDIFVPQPAEIPPSLRVPEARTLVMPYRLCPQCHEAKPDFWKIRLLMLERLNALVKRSAR